MKRFFALFLIFAFLLPITAQAAHISWVDFSVPYESLKYAMDTDISTYEKEKHIGWIDILAVAACRTGGKCPLSAVKKAITDLEGDRSPQEFLGSVYKFLHKNEVVICFCDIVTDVCLYFFAFPY